MIKHKVSVRREDQYTVVCDQCGQETPKGNFETPGDAADHARLAGFITKFVSNIAPATWHCTKHSQQ